MNVLGRADVYTARGLSGDQDPRLAGQLSRQHYFLDIALRQTLGWCLAGRRFDLEFLNEFVGIFGDDAQDEDAGAGKRLLVVIPQEGVFGNGKLLDHAILHPLFGDIGQHLFGQGSGRLASHVFTI